MIFFFTGTGNSRYIADRLAEATGDRLVSMPEAMETRSFTLEQGEKLGFVFPVYFYGLPSFVLDFMYSVDVAMSEDTYIYLVLNCGGSTGAAGKSFSRLCEARGWKLSYTDSVIMPDNYIPMFSAPSAEKTEKILDAADPEISRIAGSVISGAEGDHNGHKGRLPGLVSSILYPFYDSSRHTSQFVCDAGACLRCGKCAEDCPDKAITIAGDGTPQWTKDSCVFCMRCINMCPAACIDYGSATRRKGRYKNPRI